MVMRIVVTGGAGYIGSHATFALVEAGHDVVVVDNLARGHHSAVDRRAELVVVDLRDTPRLARLLDGAEAVWHFAASSIVSESVRELPITETTPQRPIHPYGRTKLAIEQALQDVQTADPAFAVAILRYFNVVGCAHGLGEDHVPETHIVPILLQAAAGRRDGFAIFGDDYPTPDGTCIRDYVHVEDLVDAHRLALAALRPGDRRVYNVGLGTGWSVRELVTATQLVTGRTFPVRVEPRRPGDPPALVTDPTRIRRELRWEPRHRDVATAIAGQWAWMRQFPEGWRSGGTPVEVPCQSRPSASPTS
ncbi:MAG: UDP-glucose 4-epimerase [Myxococcota bacterium]